MKTRPTPQAQAEQLLAATTKGNRVYEYFSEQMQNKILISGQPMDYWEDKFKVRIPTDDLTPRTSRDISMKLMDLNQEATFLLNMAMTKSQLIKHGNDSVFMTKFNDLVEEYKNSGKRLPAKGTLENLARLDNIEVESAMTRTDTEVRYWKNILDHLAKCQSIVKNASLMISTEMKYNELERQVSILNKKENNNE